MKKLLFAVLIMVMSSVGLVSNHTGGGTPKAPTFDDAVEIIKKYEGLHSAKHWPLVGYGHKVLPGEKFTRGKALTEAQADKLLRQDLAKLCARYRSFGPDSLLLAALAYNTGIGTVSKSSVLKKLQAGDRNIKANYLAHSTYRGRTNSQLKRRRTEEFETLFVEETVSRTKTVARLDGFAPLRLMADFLGRYSESKLTAYNLENN
ncbi:MAG: glycoside hydrolase family protein [Muribaculaceae bacterium]|nr:glycoside hydrolase family protein [Muribaculaceae bacterium]